jgi:hypothetical protein
MDDEQIKVGVAHDSGRWWVVVRRVDMGETYDDSVTFATREQAEARMMEFVASLGQTQPVQ